MTLPFFGMAVCVFCGDPSRSLARIELTGSFTSGATAFIMAGKCAIFIVKKSNRQKEIA